MSEEIELASKAIGESMNVLVERSGVLGPVKELADWVTSFIHYRRQPALARVIHKAAEKIRDEGLPPATVSDKLLREVLEGASMEDDENLQDLWANLLANAVEGGDEAVPSTLPKILRDLQPVEAQFLHRLMPSPRTSTYRPQANVIGLDVPAANLDNLERHGLVRFQPVTTFGKIPANRPIPTREAMHDHRARRIAGPGVLAASRLKAAATSSAS